MTERPYAIRRIDLVGLLLVLLVAAVLRLGRPDVLHFQYDQATQSILAQDMAAGVTLPLLGPESSSGIPHSPMSVYQLVPAFFLTHDPALVTLAIGLWNVIGVGLLWLLAHRYVHPRVALLAGLIYAVSPYAVQWSRKIWVPTSHTPFILLGLLLFLLGYVEGKRPAQAAAIPIFLIGVQTHHASWMLMPLAAWIVWQGVRRPGWRDRLDGRMVALGVLLGVLVLLPFVVGLFQYYSAQGGELSTGLGTDALRFRQKVWDRYLPLAVGLGAEGQAGEAVGDLLAVHPVPGWLWGMLGVLCLIGLVTLFHAPEDRALGVALILWVVVPPLAFWVNWSGVYWHFFIPSVAGLALASAWGAYWLAERLLTRWHRVAQVVVYGLVLVIVLSQGIWSWSMLDWVNTYYTPGAFNTPLRMQQAVGEAAAVYGDVLILGGRSHTSGYEVWHALLYHEASVREVVINGGSIAVFPAGPFAALTAPRAAPYPVEGLYTSPDSQVFPLRPAAREGGSPEGEYRVDRFAEAPAWPGPALTPAPEVSFANGVKVAGYALADGALYTAWRLPESPGTGAPLYRFFAHFLDASGERLGQRDFDFWPAKYWRADDLIVLWGEVDLPPGTVTLRLGMYRTDAAGAIQGLDAYDSGGAAMPWADLPLDDRAD